MNKEQLKKGISILYDMELNNYLMTRSIQGLEYEISHLGKRKEFVKPEREYDNRSAIDTGESVLLPCILIFGILGVIIGFIWGTSWTDIDFFAFFCAIIGAAIMGGIFAFIGMIVAVIVAAIKGKMEIDDNNERLSEKYVQNERIYNMNLRLDQERVENELQEKDLLIAQRNALITRRKVARAKLMFFYDKVGIDKNFSNLLPIAYMYEFMRLHISDKLEGADGLYYLVSRELKVDKMYLKLEEISSKFDTIIDNQHRLYDELSSLNLRCEKLIENTCMAAEIAAENNSLLQEAVENTEIAAYNTERIARENEYQSFLMTWKY